MWMQMEAPAQTGALQAVSTYTFVRGNQDSFFFLKIKLVVCVLKLDFVTHQHQRAWRKDFAQKKQQARVNPPPVVAMQHA